MTTQSLRAALLTLTAAIVVVATPAFFGHPVPASADMFSNNPIDAPGAVDANNAAPLLDRRTVCQWAAGRL
jgi:hypothetical protein